MATVGQEKCSLGKMAMVWVFLVNAGPAKRGMQLVIRRVELMECRVASIQVTCAARMIQG